MLIRGAQMYVIGIKLAGCNQSYKLEKAKICIFLLKKKLLDMIM